MKRTLLNLVLVSLVWLSGCGKSEKPDARIVVTASSFEQLVKSSGKPIVLDFWAAWCGPCKMMDPIFAEVSEERPDVVFGKVNVDQEPTLAQKYDIHAIPTLLVIVDGKVVKSSVGAMTKEALVQLLNEVIKGKP